MWLILLVIILPSQLVYAGKVQKASSAEDVAIAYYRTGKIVPNFERWIKEREPYTNTPWSLRESMYEHQYNRLQRVYQTFDPTKNTLVVETSAFLEAIKNEKSADNTTYKITAKFEKGAAASYFPYDFMGERIVIMPYHLQKIMNSPISLENYNDIQQKNIQNAALRTIIHMAPFQADFTRPYLIDEKEQWVFKTKIASMEFWNKDILVWGYTAPWYISPNAMNIQQLHKNRPKDSNFKKGTVKPMGTAFK